MPTRLKKPSLIRRLAITTALLGVQAYLVWSSLGGNYGIEAQRRIEADLAVAQVQESAVDADIARYRERIALLAPERLDPDLLTERARALLGMANPRDIIVPLAD